MQIWLNFLIRYNPAYGDVSIDYGMLCSRSVDGCVAERILTQLEDEKDGTRRDMVTQHQNSNRSTSGIIESVEEEELFGKQLGPEKGGATGDVELADGEIVTEHFLKEGA